MIIVPPTLHCSSGTLGKVPEYQNQFQVNLHLTFLFCSHSANLNSSLSFTFVSQQVMGP